MIGAMLKGVEKAIVETAGFPASAVGLRVAGSGKPMAGYQGGGWYVGIYFAGLSTIPDQEGMSYNVEYSLGVDVTRILSRFPTKKFGQWVIQDDEFYARGQLLHQRMLRADEILSGFCNDALRTMFTNTDECGFYENFTEGQMSPDRLESGEWIIGQSEKAPTIIVLPMKFTGLKYVQPLERTPLQ